MIIQWNLLSFNYFPMYQKYSSGDSHAFLCSKSFHNKIKFVQIVIPSFFHVKKKTLIAFLV
jgi:hypothetical protein